MWQQTELCIFRAQLRLRTFLFGVMTVEAESKKYGIGWLRFYVKWRFPIAFIVGAISIINEISQGTRQGWFSVPEFIFWLIVDVAIYFFRFPVFDNLMKLNEKGYELNGVLLVIETVTMVVRTAFRDDDILFGLVLGIPMGILIWWLPNHVYFKHRKYLFTGTKTLNELIEDYKKEEQKPNAESIAEPDTKEKPVQQTPVLRSLPQEEKGAPSEDAQQLKYCRICGKQLPAGSKFCTECGTEVAVVSPSRFEKLRKKATGQKTIRTLPVQKAEDQPRKIEFPREKMNSTLRRGFLFLEDEEWENADRYFERVLDEEPENAYAHLGKLMVEQKLANVEQLKEYAETVNESKHFKRVLRFADEDLGTFLRTLREPDDESDTDDSVEASEPATTLDDEAETTQNPDGIDAPQQEPPHSQTDGEVTMEDALAGLFAEMLGANKGETSQSFAEQMEEASKRRDLLFERQEYEADDYGLSATNPVMTSSISSSKEYLKHLRSPEGKAFTWNRSGFFDLKSVHGVPNVIVDEYQLFLDGKAYKAIYVCPYGHQTKRAPKGLVYKE